MKTISIKIFLLFVLAGAVLTGCSKSDDGGNDLLIIPNAFTPNGDNLNDEFIVQGQDIASYDIKIYDQNNLLVYSSTNINRGWDGTFDGRPLPAGSYAYRIEYEDIYGRKYRRTGSVELIR